MKSALANIGENDLSGHAGTLEQAGRDKNFAVIMSETGPFLDALQLIVDRIDKIEKADDNTADSDPQLLHKQLNQIIEACKENDDMAAQSVLSGLRKKQWSSSTKELLDKVDGHILYSDFNAVVSEVTDFLNSKV